MRLLLIHGAGGRPRTWRWVLERLDQDVVEYAVTADVLPTPGDTIEELARDLLLHLDGPLVLVGHSMGAMLAQQIALLAPGRVLGMVLISTIPGATDAVAAHNEALALDIEARGIHTVAGEFADRLLGPGTSNAADVKDAFVADMVACGPQATCSALRAIARWNTGHRIPSGVCPVELLAGEAEPDLERQRSLAATMGAHFEAIAGAGHLAPLEAPDRVVAAIRRTLRRIG